MTCQELRLYFEDPFRMDAEFRAEAEHLVHCAECTRFVEARRKLGAGLHLIRESVPQPSTALDTVVLTNYRRQVAGRPSGNNTTPRRRRLAMVCWSATAAALALAAALAFLSIPRTGRSAVQLPAARPPSASQPVTLIKTANIVRSTKPMGPHSARHQRLARAVEAVENPAPTEFRSLMYCDELSCGGAMQVIRVQLPPSAAVFSPGAALVDGAIYADVLVGPDGIARGIRVVE